MKLQAVKRQRERLLMRQWLVRAKLGGNAAAARETT